VLKFPVPFLHELDGGRYIGTDDLVIMRDPEENWVNCGTYRVMVHDAKRVGVWMSPGKHGRQIREKHFKRGEPCRSSCPAATTLCSFSPEATSCASGFPNTIMRGDTAVSRSR